MLSGSDIWCKFELNQQFSFLVKRKKRTIKIQASKHLDIK
jgi:hypothetical protein